MTGITLSELLRTVQMAVRGALPDTYWVRAEVSSLSARPGSHCYMELIECEPGSRELFTAKVRANCWRQNWQAISTNFEQTAGQPLRVGMQILAEVSVDFHPVYGMSLLVQDIDPTFTLGDLARQKQETLRRLEKEGVLDMQKMLQLPSLPRRLAVVSSDTAAGYQDFQHQLLNNAYGFCFRTALFPAVMQGDTAAASIVAALNLICQEADRFDAVVIIRGGGASTDLSCFDQYAPAACCAQFPLPILTGIGHTRDVSVLDQVAYMALKTPTAVAEFLIGKMQEQQELLDDLQARLSHTAELQIRLRRDALARAEMRFQMGLSTVLHRQRNRLDLYEKTLQLHNPERIYRLGYSLTTKDGKVVRNACELQPGDIIHTAFAQGETTSLIQ